MPGATMVFARLSRLVSRKLTALPLLIAAALVFGPTSNANADTTLEVSYKISMAGLTVGIADATSRFSQSSYSIVIKGMTSGISSLFIDSRTTLLGNGRISGTNVQPHSYSLETSESGFEAHVRMSMRAGTIIDLLATPRLREAADRVPIRSGHKRSVLDPIGAFLIATDKFGISDGHRVCDRTIRVFDGWQRFDIRLSYTGERQVTGADDAYNGMVVMCAARYIPVAGHRESRKAVNYMANNKRLEVWYAPIDGAQLLVPYRIKIGTKFGDFTVTSTSFTAASS